ncbi:MAG: hypothetical protein ACR2IH_02260 [Pyrinomonadaceae bacterium]
MAAFFVGIFYYFHAGSMAISPAILTSPTEQQQPTRSQQEYQKPEIIGRKMCFAVFHRFSPMQRASLQHKTSISSAKSITPDEDFFCEDDEIGAGEASRVLYISGR